MSLFVYILVSVEFIYLLLCLYMYWKQRSILFQPSGQMMHPSHYQLFEMQEEILTTGDQVNIVCWYQPPPEQHAPVIVYFHGNAVHLGEDWRINKFRSFIEHGYGVCSISYRGYGNSEGHASEQGLYTDARAMLHYVMNDKKIAQRQLILYGESLGTGVAVQMALEYQRVKALILEAPYRSIERKGVENYPWLPVRILIKDRFDSISKAPHIKTPTLIIHGELDQTIPVSHGRDLLQSLKTKKKKGIFPPDNSHTDFDPEFLTQQLTEFCASSP